MACLKLLYPEAYSLHEVTQTLCLVPAHIFSLSLLGWLFKCAHTHTHTPHACSHILQLTGQSALVAYGLGGLVSRGEYQSFSWRRAVRRWGRARVRNSAHPLNASRGPAPRGVCRGTPDGACWRWEIESCLHVGCKEESREASSERFVFKYAGEEQQSSAYYMALLTARLSLPKETMLSLVISEKCPQENGAKYICRCITPRCQVVLFSGLSIETCSCLERKRKIAHNAIVALPLQSIYVLCQLSKCQ